LRFEPFDKALFTEHLGIGAILILSKVGFCAAANFKNENFVLGRD
jgi:hypothetical protein